MCKKKIAARMCENIYSASVKNIYSACVKTVYNILHLNWIYRERTGTEWLVLGLGWGYGWS